MIRRQPCHAARVNEVAIEAELLGRRYGRIWALANVSFAVERGTVVMVAGRNGSGKSTLLRVLATAIHPDLGRGSVAGFDLVRERYDVRNVSALLGHASYLYESLTARENLEVVADHLGRGRDRVKFILERVDLAARANDAVSVFSAGMRKRLSFARVLLQEPSVIFLDEPYSHFDPAGFALVDDVVRELKARGTTVVMATHQLERAATVADRALVLEGGRLTWSGSPDQIPRMDNRQPEAGEAG